MFEGEALAKSRVENARCGAAAIRRDLGRYEAKVVRVNPVPAPAKQRLLVELRGDWPEQDPMQTDEFEPIGA
jgi:hypothetical protein